MFLSNKRIPVVSILGSCVALIAAAQFGICNRPSPQLSEIIPCSVGTYWVYDAVSREGMEGATKTEKKKYKLTVIDAVTTGGIKAALVERKDLSGGEPPQFTRWLVFNNKSFYESETSQEEWQALKKSIASGQLPKTPEESNLQMALPAKVGSTWDHEGAPDRTDNMYCWSVENVKPVEASTVVAGFRLPQNTAEYTIAFRTCPDHTTRKFVPGIGFTDLEYRHHGTIIDSDEHLVEFHNGVSKL